MALNELIEQHEKCREQLIIAINKGATTQEVRTIDARLSQLFSAIEAYDACAPQDIAKQLHFFMALQKDVEGSPTSSIYLKSISVLVDRYADRMASHGNSVKNSVPISSRFKISLECGVYYTKEMIEPSRTRVSLFNTEFCYQFTSDGNAQFYGASPSDFVGKHVVDFIGTQRFAQRVKSRMENCFSGFEQRYFHYLSDKSENERLIDCQMMPFYDSDNCVRGAYVAVADITDKLENARNIPPFQ